MCGLLGTLFYDCFTVPKLTDQGFPQERNKEGEEGRGEVSIAFCLLIIYLFLIIN